MDADGGNALGPRAEGRGRSQGPVREDGTGAGGPQKAKTDMMAMLQASIATAVGAWALIGP
ncbi:hypothetical protein Sm713_49970 [Streptomyces sp. TS71-3]|nr:hypothetical protein Sm713_49970 [Streptomyces sp. TS71-3]